MYKILIKYPNEKFSNLWEQYGTNTSSTTDSASTFTEFETDDVSVLKAEIEKLDKEYGHKNVRVIKDITVTYTATIAEDVDGDNNNNAEEIV